MTKKETQMLNRERIKLADQHRGIKDMRRLPDAIIVVDAQYEDTAIREAKRLDIPVIAIVDSNTDPEKVDYPIPANDDSMRTIQLIISALADAVVEARSAASKKDEKKDMEISTADTPADEPGSEAAPEDTPASDAKDDGKVQESEDISEESTQEEE
jgi:small subunit ribosomal protein S2